VQQAAAGTSEVADNIGGASSAARQSSEVAGRVLAVSGDLNQQCATLFEQVETFLLGLRRAA
jgi:methyl-accepting chemotaxis protein